MKKSIVLVATIATLLLFSACNGEKSSSYKKLQNSYDSLLVQNTRNNQELDDVMNLILEIEDEIAKVSAAEYRIRVSSSDGEMSEDVREQLRSDVAFLTKSLQENKELLAKQMEQLKKKDINLGALNKKISNLQQQITEKENVIAELTSTLAEKDKTIQEQEGAINNLEESKRTHEATIAIQDKQLAQQDKKLHTGYYCFGTAKELKEQNILAGGGLFSKSKVLPEGFNQDYFIQIDTRNISTIQLFAPKALLRTDHPASSYELVKDNEGNMSLKILDKENFWSRTKYLVVEITL